MEYCFVLPYGSFCPIYLCPWFGYSAKVPISSGERSTTSDRVDSWFTGDIPIDHFGTGDERKFSNRYWINDTFYKKGGPVFFFDTGVFALNDISPAFKITENNNTAGEHGVSDSMVSIFLEESLGSSALMALARRYGGLAILWEHRFYGQSLPFELDLETGIAVDGYEAYKYHTVEQVC
jgi:Serine carboxypeptidase S28.